MFVCCILDTEHLYTEIIEGIVGQYGKTFTLDIKVKQMGRKEPEAAKVVIGMLLSCKIQEILYRRRQYNLDACIYLCDNLRPKSYNLSCHSISLCSRVL